MKPSFPPRPAKYFLAVGRALRARRRGEPKRVMDCGGKAQPRHRFRPRPGFPQASPPSPASGPHFCFQLSPFQLLPFAAHHHPQPPPSFPPSYCYNPIQAHRTHNFFLAAGRVAVCQDLRARRRCEPKRVMDCGGKAQPRHLFRPRPGFPQASPPSPASGPHFSFCLFTAPHHPPSNRPSMRTPIRFALFRHPRERASVLECGGPPPLFPSAPMNLTSAMEFEKPRMDTDGHG